MIGPILAAVLATAAPIDTTLDNGLRVVLIPHRANPMVASAVVVGAGVVDEPPGAGGSSHFLEHLLFDGTTTRTQKELYDAADRIGAYNNATTREDHTLFTLLVASRHAREGLEIQADMLFRSTIPADSFEKERKIVLEELARDRSDPAYDREQAFRRTAFAGTPMERPVLGTEESLASIQREAVVAYYKQRYVPGNMTLVVMGDFEPPAMLDAVRSTFGTAKKGKRPSREVARWPAPAEANVEIAAAASADDTGMDAAFPFDADPWDKISVAAEILLAAAADGEDAPLAQALAARGIEGEGELSLARRTRPWSAVVFRAPAGGGSPTAALEALVEAVRSTRRGGAARARLDRAIARARADGAIARDQIHYFALLRGDRILGAPPGTLATEAQLLRGLGPDDWDAAYARLESGLGQLRARVASSLAPPGKISWRVPAPGAPATGDQALRAGVLDNGLRYVARRSDDSDVVAMHVAFTPRAAAEAPGLDGVTDLLHRALLRTAGMQDRLDRLGARVRAVDDPGVPFDDYYTTPEFSWIRLEVPSDSWREAVAIVGEMVRKPELTDEALEQGRAAMVPLAERRLKSPREVALSKLDALIAPGHPLTRSPGGRPETLRAVTIDALRARHASLATGRGTIVSLVGPMDADEAVLAIRSAFGGLAAGEAPAAARLPSVEKPGSEEIELEAPQGYVALGRTLDVPDAERGALTVAVAALSDRLAFDLRETRGLAYSISASLRPWGNRWRLDITMGTRQDNLAAAESGIGEVLAGLRSRPPDAEEIARVVQALRGRALMRRMTRISLAYEAGMEVMRGEAPGDERRAIDALDGVGADDVRRVIERDLGPEALARVVVR